LVAGSSRTAAEGFLLKPPPFHAIRTRLPVAPHAAGEAVMEAIEFADHVKELHALQNKMLAFPEEDWRRERERVAELEKMIAQEARKPAHA
jgi:dihydrodipicolinate synthase/N-acetylneuraminate lyase